MTLLDLREGKVGQIIGFNAGYQAIQKLSAIGFYKDQKIKIVGNSPFSGPILVEDIGSGGRIALGRGLALKVLVKEIDEKRLL